MLGHYALLNHNIYIATDPTPGDAAHVCHCIVRPQYSLSESWRPIYFTPTDPQLQVIENYSDLTKRAQLF